MENKNRQQNPVWEFTKTIIPFALFGYEVIITNLRYALVGYFITLYPPQARGIKLLLFIQISYTVRIPIFWLVDLCHVTLGYDATTSLTSLSWCNSRGVNSIHHCHYNHGFGWFKVWRFLFAVYSIWIIKMLTHSLLMNYRDLPALVH